jgi:hypothetical protein
MTTCGVPPSIRSFLYMLSVTGRRTRYFFPHSQESLIETYPALIMSAVRGAEIWRLDVDGEGVVGV